MLCPRAPKTQLNLFKAQYTSEEFLIFLKTSAGVKRSFNTHYCFGQFWYFKNAKLFDNQKLGIWEYGVNRSCEIDLLHPGNKSIYLSLYTFRQYAF